MSSSLDLDDIPRLDPQAQLVFGDDDDVHIVNSGNAWHFSGLSRGVLERLLAVVDGRRSVREICAAMALRIALSRCSRFSTSSWAALASTLSTTFSGYPDRAKGFALLPLFTTARLSPLCG